MSKKSPDAAPQTGELLCEDIRTSSTPSTIARAIVENLQYVKGRTPAHATTNDWYVALAHTVRDRLLQHWIATVTARRRQPKIVAYLSAEFLPGPHLGNALLCLGITRQVEEAVALLNLDLSTLLDHEQEPGLGNGGLGRLAACFLDSLATLQIPAIGYGIRYEFGIFDQEISDGWQKEITDKWLATGNPWEISRPEIAYYVHFGGRTETYADEEGRPRVRWIPGQAVKGVAYDTPIPGYRRSVVDLLRLWKSEAVESFDFQAFNVGDYYGAVHEKIASETITKILYPNDDPAIGKRLRLTQQYFFVSCSLRDVMRIHELQGNPLSTFSEGFAVQLNDTHPSIAVAELMRIFVDERRMDWDEAWTITQKTFSYTNHTLLSEALETWPLPLFRELLPRHLEIIFEINRRFLDGLRSRGMGDNEQLRRLSLIDEAGDKAVRMAHLATVGSHAVNGVAALHTELLKETVLREVQAWQVKRNRLESLNRDRLDREEFLHYQLREIVEVNPQAGEDDALADERKILANVQRLSDLAARAHTMLYDGDGAILEKMQAVTEDIREIRRIDHRLEISEEEIAAHYYQLEEAAFTLRDYTQHLSFDPGRMEAIDDRMERLGRLKRKHGGSLESVLRKRTEMETELRQMLSMDEELKTNQEALAAALSVLAAKADELSRSRKASAVKLQNEIDKQIHTLRMPGARFEVVFNDYSPDAQGDRYRETGMDDVRFHLSTNPGEALKPLNRVASGGELSRIVLAMKKVLAGTGFAGTIVFDEVDSGIGGATAEIVGEKIREVAAHHQVLCITHLPQIACFADSHYRVSKQVKAGKTATAVDVLSDHERLEEMARMLGGIDVTETTRQHAREMLNITSRGQSS